MKRIYTYIIIAIAALAFASCEKEIEFTGEETAPYIMFFSEPTDGCPWVVRITQSRFFLSNDTIRAISDAQIEATVNGQPLNTTIQYLGNGRYDMGYTPHCGDTISVRVNVAGLLTITSGCRVPNKANITNIEFSMEEDSRFSRWDEYTQDSVISINGTINVSFKLSDPAGEHNYYMLRLAESHNGDDNWHYNYFWLDDNVLFDNTGMEEIFDLGISEPDNEGNRIFFTDERINGKEHTIKVRGGYYLWSSNIGSEYNSQSRLEIYTLSRDMYLFYKTLKAVQYQDEITSIFAEPVQLHTNVTGGIGVLGGSAKVVIDVDPTIFMK